MKKPISLLTLLLFLSVTACAQHTANMHDHHAASPSPAEANETQDWAKERLAKSSRHQEWVKVKNGAREVSSFLVYPETKNKATAVVVIHEIFGMSPWVQSLTDELAEAGYIAIAPDLLSGMGPNGGGSDSLSGNQVGQKIRDLPPDQITGDLNAVVDFVSKLPASNGKVVVAGFCWGGSQSFRYATNNPNIKAAFVFYGSAPMTTPDNAIDKTALARIKAPVYGFYAGNDARITATVPATTQAMNELKKKYEPVTYDGAGHGFMRAGDAPEPTDTTAADYQKQLDAFRFNRSARDEAWARWKKLLAAM